VVYWVFICVGLWVASSEECVGVFGMWVGCLVVSFWCSMGMICLLRMLSCFSMVFSGRLVWFMRNSWCW